MSARGSEDFVRRILERENIGEDALFLKID